MVIMWQMDDYILNTCNKQADKVVHKNINVKPPLPVPSWVLVALIGNRFQPAGHFLPGVIQQLNQIFGHITILVIEKWCGKT